MTKNLSIIIINWNSKEYLRKCLESIYRNTNGVDYEIIVVDNASFDGCGQVLQREFPDVLFLQSPNFLGFAGANNLGFEKSSGSTLLFLNPDTEVIGPAISVMVSHLQGLPEAGLTSAL